MYEKKRIISEPVSNNRLNYHERENKKIVVPSLIEWTMDDVLLSEEIAIECEVDGTIIAGKWLRHFVYLKNARVPTWIMDNHNHAFAFWHEALWKWYIRKWALLVHIDQHTDLAKPNLEKREKFKEQSKGLIKNKNPQFFSLNSSLLTLNEVEEWKIKNEDNVSVIPDAWVQAVRHESEPESRWITTQREPFTTPEEAEEYTNSVLTIADFVVPALATGLISEALMVTWENKEWAWLFTWENNSLIKKSSVLPETSDLLPPLSIVVDIDLDYFSQWFDEKKCMETVKYWIEKADIITIATSPLFIEQDEALRVLKSLQKALLTL